MRLTEAVYKGTSSVNVVQFMFDGVLAQFYDVTRVVCKFRHSAVEADTDVDDTLVEWDTDPEADPAIGEGRLRFLLVDLDIPAGEYPTTLIVYSPTYPDGLVLAHQDQGKLIFTFYDT